LYKTGKEPTEGRDMTGRWIELQSEDDEESVPF
jgi:hypothetical protein